MAKKQLTESEEKGVIETLTDTRYENYVLRMRIKTNEKSKERENRLQNEEINAMMATIEELNIKIGDQADKIHQLDTSNIRKDFQIEGMATRLKGMEKRLKEISGERDTLKHKILEMKEMNDISTEEKAFQGEKIQKLESELREVRKELNLMWEQKEKQEKDMQNAQDRQDEKLQRMVKETVKETVKEAMKEGFAELLSTKEHRKEQSDVSKGSKFHIVVNAVDNVQIAKNIVEQRPRLKPNRRVLKPSNFSMQFP